MTAKSKKARSKKVRNPRKLKESLRSKVIIVLVTVVVTVVTQKIIDSWYETKTSANLIAKISFAKEEILTIVRPRAKYIIQTMRDTLTKELMSPLALVVPPGTDITADRATRQYIGKILLQNLGHRVAKSVDIVIFEPENSIVEIGVPRMVKSSIRSLPQDNLYDQQGRIVTIEELGGQQDLVITVIYKLQKDFNEEDGFNIGGYMIYGGKNIIWSKSGMKDCLVWEETIPESLRQSDDFSFHLKGHPRFKDSIPVITANWAGFNSLEEAIQDIEEDRFPWEAENLQNDKTSHHNQSLHMDRKDLQPTGRDIGGVLNY